MKRRKKLVHLNFDWEKAAPFQRPNPETDPLMQPLFGGVFQYKLFIPVVVFISLFASMVIVNTVFRGSDPETDAYFFAVEQRAESVCVGEVDYVGDAVAVVPVVWKTVTGEVGVASLSMEKTTRFFNVGERWKLDRVTYERSGFCSEDQWQPTAWRAAVSAGRKTPATASGSVVPDRVIDEMAAKSTSQPAAIPVD